MVKQLQQALVILRRKRLEERIGIKRSSIYGKLDPKSKNYDPTFPRMVSLGARSVGWYEHEVEEWLASRMRSTKHNRFNRKKKISVSVPSSNR